MQSGKFNELFGTASERKYFLGEMAKNTIDPIALQQIAKWTDEEDKRSPETIFEHIKTGIPGARETVPTPMDRKIMEMFKTPNVETKEELMKKAEADMEDAKAMAEAIKNPSPALKKFMEEKFGKKK